MELLLLRCFGLACRLLAQGVNRQAAYLKVTTDLASWIVWLWISCSPTVLKTWKEGTGRKEQGNNETALAFDHGLMPRKQNLFMSLSQRPYLELVNIIPSCILGVGTS